MKHKGENVFRMVSLLNHRFIETIKEELEYAIYKNNYLIYDLMTWIILYLKRAPLSSSAFKFNKIFPREREV
jgi:hypothetical protein